jgi:hypothetical protein
MSMCMYRTAIYMYMDMYMFNVQEMLRSQEIHKNTVSPTQLRCEAYIPVRLAVSPAPKYGNMLTTNGVSAPPHTRRG